MSYNRSYPNRVSIQCSTAGTGWQLLGTNGVGYASYVALLAAGTTAAPGPPTSFPTGAPRLIAQALTSGGLPSTTTMSVATNTLIAPTVADFNIPVGDVGVIDDAGVKSVWFKKETSGDLADFVFQF